MATEIVARPPLMPVTPPMPVLPTHEILTRLDADHDAEERCVYVIADSASEQTWGCGLRQLPLSRQGDLEHRSRAFLRSLFTPWRQAAREAATQAVTDMLAGELGRPVAMWFRSQPASVQRHIAAGLFARAKAAHDGVLEQEAPLLPRTLFAVRSAVARIREAVQS